MNIKKHLFFTVICLCVINNCLSQNYSYGARAGINTMNTYTNTYDKKLYSFGYDFGLFAQRKIYDNFSLGLEFNMTQKKIASDKLTTSSFIETVDQFFLSLGSFLPVEISIKDILETYLGASSALINDTVFTYYKDMTHFTYFEMPLLLSYKYKKLTIEAGPNFSFLYESNTKSVLKQEIALMDMLPTALFDTVEYGTLITGTINSLFPAYKDTIFEETQSTGNYSSFNMGIIAGISYEISDNLYLSLKYSHIFSNMYNNKEREAFHSLVNLSLKYNIRPLFKDSAKF